MYTGWRKVNAISCPCSCTPRNQYPYQTAARTALSHQGLRLTFQSYRLPLIHKLLPPAVLSSRNHSCARYCWLARQLTATVSSNHMEARSLFQLCARDMWLLLLNTLYTVYAFVVNKNLKLNRNLILIAPSPINLIFPLIFPWKHKNNSFKKPKQTFSIITLFQKHNIKIIC